MSEVDLKKELKEQMLFKMNEGAYKQIAQKLDKHLQDIYQAQESQKNRWIWELIQNAKDAPNTFDLNIRIEIQSNQMKFMHNADPFTLDNLIGLVQQFSSKSDKIDAQAQTTGKYGTGFITTHMISRVIQVEGIFQYQLKQIQHKKIKDFKIVLDRDYKDRDIQLVNKVAKNMAELRQLQQTKGRIFITRKFESFDTIFTYKNLDKTSLRYIDQGINDLIRSCHYTLLFNKKIQKIQIIDRRQAVEKIKIIERGQSKVFQDLNLFETIISQLVDYKLTNKQSKYLAYQQNLQLGSIVAVPVNYNFISVSILKIQKDIPRIFKEFPLIGTENWGYNYVITCKYFEPNEKRSGIRLKLIEGRQDPKVVRNRQYLQNILSEVEKFFKQLSSQVQKGIQYLAISNNNSTEDIYQYVQKHVFLRFRQFVQELQIVKTKKRGKQFISLNKIKFPLMKNVDTKQNKIESLELYKQFQYLFDEKQIDLEAYKKFYDILIIRKQNWNAVQFININWYIKELQRLGSNGLKELINPFPIIVFLKSVYQFIKKYYPSYIKPKEPIKKIKGGIQQIQYPYEPQIILNQNGVFKKLSELRIQSNLPQIFKLYAQKLGIDINDQLIDTEIQKNFLLEKKYDAEYIASKVHIKFETNNSLKSLDNHRLRILFNFMSTYPQSESQTVNRYDNKFRRKIFKICKKLMILKDENEVYVKENFELDFKLFVLKFFAEIVKIINKIVNGKKSVLNDLREILYLEKEEIISWLNDFQQLISNLSFKHTNFHLNDFIIHKLPTYSQNFIDPESSIFLNYKLSPQQIDLYNIYTQFSFLQTNLIHPQLKFDLFKSSHNIFAKKNYTFAEIFSNTLSQFQRENKEIIFQDKGNNKFYQNKSRTDKVIKYCQNLFVQKNRLQKQPDPYNQLILQEKLKAFKRVLDYRLEISLIVSDININHKNSLMEIIQNQNELDALMSIMKKYQSLQKVELKLSDLKKN